MSDEAAVRELAESNKRILARINEIEAEKQRRREHKRRCYLEMDIDFIMAWKDCNREKALAKLKEAKYDVAKVIQSSMSKLFRSDDYLEHVLAHYEYKKNRRIIEGW